MAQKQIVIFDFDKTLTTEEVGIFEVSSAGDRVFGGLERVAMLASLLKHLASSGVLMFIVSRNSSHVVRKALQHVGWTSYFVRVFGFEDASSFEHGVAMFGVPLKSGLIRLEILEAYGVEPARALFVDDDSKNIQDVEGIGCKTRWVKGFGLNAEDDEQIRAWVASRKHSQVDDVHDKSKKICEAV
eukprot:gene1282-1867_t